MKNKTFLSSLILVLVLSLALPSGVWAAAPSNDAFADATLIGQLPFNDAMDTSEATVAVDDPDCAGQGVTVWYSFTPAADTTLVANTSGSNYDTTLSIYTGTQGALTQITCNDDSDGTLQSYVQIFASAGVTYYLMAGQYGTGGTGGALVLSVDELPVLVNDDVDNAIPINSLPFTDTRDTFTATTAADDPYCGYRNATVWYQFTPVANARVELDTSASSYFADITVVTGPRGGWGYVNCSYSAQTSFFATAGQTYYIMVSTYVSSGGSLVLSANLIPAPVNDDVDNAIVIGSLPFNDTRDTSGATTAADDPYCGYRNATVWYAFTPTVDTRVELDATASDYFPNVTVFTGPRGAWSYISCNNSPLARFDAVAGQTYYIMVAAYGLGGNLSFSMKLAPPPLAIDLNLDPMGSVKPTTGVVTVRGTVTCNQASNVSGWGYVEQKIGNGLVTGYVYISGYCEPSTPLAWTSTLYSQQPAQGVGGGRAATLFTGGRATASLAVTAWSAYSNEYAYDTLTATVTLRGGR